MIITYRTALFLKNVIEKDELLSIAWFSYFFTVNFEALHKNKLARKTVITKLHEVIIFSIFNEETFGISTPKTVTINKPYKRKIHFPTTINYIANIWNFYRPFIYL